MLPLAVHEYTHFIDATSTLWGLRHLLMMKEAYEANDVLSGNETDFYKAKRFYDFPTIAVSCPIEDILEVKSDHQSISYFRNGLLSCDYGTLFYLLCCALPNGNYTSNQSILSLVDIATERVGINVEISKMEADIEADKLYQKLKNTSVNVILQLAEAGFVNYKNLNISRLNMPFDGLNLPPVLLSDSNSALSAKSGKM